MDDKSAPTQTMTFNTATLPNGLRVIHMPSDSPVVYCGYQVNAGARQEKSGEEGLAHFCEHITFKGTGRRNAWNILNSLESVGGDINAYTNKENTVFYAAVPAQYARRAVDLLTDIVFHSVYPQKEIDKEVEVICDEIESYNDSPADLIYDDFENIIFHGHPLGHNILGSAERVRSFTTADALRFTRRYYRPENTVFFMYGGDRMPGIKVGDLESCPTGDDAAEPGALTLDCSTSDAAQQGVVVRERGTHQAHVMYGCRAYDFSHPCRTTLYLLNNMLGGPGMNSRLNIELRERRGLVYTVDSSMVSYSDTGLWCVYLGCDPHDVNRCLGIVRRQLDLLSDKGVSERKLMAAKKQLKGQISIACDNHENFALDFGRTFLHTGKEHDIEALCRRIDAVTAQDIQDVARQLFAPERMTTLIYK